MRLSVNVAVGLTALAAILVAPTLASYGPIGQPDTFEQRWPERDIKAETELHCLAVAIFFEGGSTAETLEGQRHIARVVTERAKAGLRKWGGRDLCDVVFYKRAGVCQFTWRRPR